MTHVAVGLARVSTQAQGKEDSISLDSQVEKIQTYAKAHDFQLVSVEKEMYSGLSSDRPTVDKLKTLIIEHKIAHLIVFSPDRYTRNILFGALFDQWLSTHNVTLHYVTRGAVDTSTPSGRLQNNIERSFSAYEADVIRDRSVRAKRDYLDQNIPVVQGRAKYGYKRIGKKAKAYLEIVEDEAKLVRMIFDTFISTGNVFEVARQLKPYLTRAGRVWNTGVLYQILRDEIYAGVYSARKVERIQGVKIRRDKEDWVRMEVPAIIDRAVWEKAQELLNTGRRKKAETKYTYLLRGKVFCTCGRSATPYTAPVRKETHIPYHYYRCNSVYKLLQGLKPCNNTQSYHGSVLDSIVWDWVVTIVEDKTNTINALYRLEQEKQKEISCDISKKEDAIKLRYEMQTELDRQILAYGKATGAFADSIFKRCEELSKSIKELDTMIQRSSTLTTSTSRLDALEGILNDISKQDLNTLDLNGKMYIVHLINPKIILVDSVSINICLLWRTWEISLPVQ
jgi:site-specific DNA recombinase